MDIAPIDFTALSKWVGGLLIALAAYTYQKIDSRVSKLEDDAVRKQEFAELRDDVRGLYGRIDDLKDELLEVWKDR